MKQRILLTGDDGYDSLGTRVLIHVFRDEFDLAIAGTKEQQSGVGGHKNVMKTGVWGETNVDGVPAIWIDGSPVDAVEAALQYFSCPFDYVISGINWGVNIGGCLVTSGTFSAALYSVNMGVGTRAIAVSWDIPPVHHFVRLSTEDDIASFIDHPGRAASKVIHEAITHHCWGAALLNINIPVDASKQMEFAAPLTPIDGFWPPMILDHATKQFSYARGNHVMTMGGSTTDVQVLERGHIAVTPCQTTMIDQPLYQKLTSNRDK